MGSPTSFGYDQQSPISDKLHGQNCDEENDVNQNSNQDIAWSAFCMVIPMLLLTAGLVGFIMLFKVDKSTILPITPGKIENSAIYVNVDSTLLVFASSWMSSLVPFLTAFAIALATYPIAQQLLHHSNDDKHEKLLTSFQLSIAIKFVNGSTWSSLWNLLQYSTSWRKPAARHGAVLISVAMVTVVVVVLGVAILAADTWLHIATKSVNVIRISGLPRLDAYYGLDVLPQCTSTNNSYNALKAANLSCTVTTRLLHAAMNDTVSTLQTLNNQSSTFAVHGYTQGSKLYYLGPVATAINASYDYTASTFAVNTVCKPISTQCNLILNTNATYNCSNGAFYGEGPDLSIAGVRRQSFRYSNMSGYNEDYYLADGVDNPFFTAGAAMNAMSSVIPEERRHDPELKISNNVTIGAIFFCNTTVFDAEYDVVRSEVVRFDTKPSNVSITNMFASAVVGTTFGYPNALIAMKIAAPDTVSAQQYADAFADSLSTMAVASGASSVRLAPILNGQRRDSLLLAQVPKAPLFLLVGLNLTFVILGLVLAVLAALTSDEARAVQFRLSIAGIVANLFEGRRARARVQAVEHLFGEFYQGKEDVRIKVERTSTGGFIFKSVGDCQENVNFSKPIQRPPASRTYTTTRFPSMLPIKQDGLLVEDKVMTDMYTGQRWI